MTRKHVDPELGDIEVPDPPTPEEFEARRAEARRAAQRQRLWPHGSVSKCPRCDERALEGRDDLTQRVTRPGQIIVFRHLRGAKCRACEAQFLEPGEALNVEAEAGPDLVGDYEVKVSRIGSGTLGTYWPKDLVRVLGLKPKKRAFVKVLDADTALVSFES